MGEFIADIFTFLLVFCVVSLAVMAALTAFVIYRLRRIWQASTTDMQTAYARYRQRNPQASERAALQHLIKAQARRCGVIGIFTSFGGFFTMALALPIDLYLTGRIQANLAHFIAEQYGRDLDVNDPGLANVRNNLSLSPEAQITRGQQRLARETTQFFTRKIFSKFIPLIGAFLGYRFNYLEAKQTGEQALKHYSSVS